MNDETSPPPPGAWAGRFWILLFVVCLLAGGIFYALHGLRGKFPAAKPEETAPSFTLTLIKAGSGHGSTTPESRPAPGTAHYLATAVSSLILTAAPASDSVFAGWSGDVPAGVNPQEDRLFLVLDQNRAITATFMPAQFTLTLQVSGSSNPVNVSPAPGKHGCLSGQQVFINALPADGSPASFVNWSGDVSTENFSLMITMDGDKTLTANFTDSTDAARRLVLDPPQGPGTGTYFPLGPGTYRVAANAHLKFGANPNRSSYFGGWLADYAGVNTPQELTVVMDKDHTVGASFSDTGNTLTVLLEGRGNVFPAPGDYEFAAGLQVPFTAERIDRDWHFNSWRDGNDKVLSESLAYTATINGPAPMTIKAVFAEGKKDTGATPAPAGHQ